MPVTINIPERTRVDYVWTIEVTGLHPSSEVTIFSSMNGLFGHAWSAHAVFLADERGIVDLNKQAPIAGSYSSVDPMGLIWSMSCEGVHGLLARRFDLSDAKIKFQLKDATGVVLAEKTVTRYLKEPEVTVIKVRERSLVGTLYQPSKPGKHPAMIVLSGSEGGFRHEQAALLASEGYVSLALAYFIHDQSGYNDLPAGFPKEIKNIPLEYFETAIQFLQTRPGVDPEKIGVIGTSRGGELSLLLGSVFPQFKSVIAYAPNHAVQAAFGPSDHTHDEILPSWAYQGTSVPCFPLKVDRVDWFSGRPVVLKKGFLLAFDDDSAATESASPDALIAVERINGPVLLISAKNDEMWPSYEMSSLIMKRLKEKGHRYAVQSEHHSYAGAGHLIMTPWWPTTGQHAVHPVDGVDYEFGGTPQSDAHAGYHSWTAIKHFLARHYAPAGRL